MKILIIDDSENSCLLLRTILENAGYGDIDTAGNYEDAQKHLTECHLNGTCVDLILMDIRMPGIDGIEATRLIKNDKNLSDIPVIVVSATEDETNLERAFEAGAIDYIRKPVTRIELCARVGSVLELRRQMLQRMDREKELLELTDRLRELSNRDGLTGVGNRRFFDEMLEREWRRAQREQEPISMLFIDIDYFKKFNDAYGHLQGDMCLRQVAEAIEHSIRRPTDMVTRYGGEEFAVVLPNTGLSGAEQVATIIRNNVGALEIANPDSSAGPGLTVSIGAACVTPPRSMHSKILVAAADKSLYTAKKDGRNRTTSVQL